MKPTQWKDALRNIWKQKVSYLSIIVIAFLGVTTFLGVDYTDAALRRNGSIMYNAVNFRDFEIVSAMLFDEEDLDKIRRVEGVADAEAVLQTSAKVSSREMREDVLVISLTERINLPLMVEGRLPLTAGECAVEGRLAEEMGWQLGDEIQAKDARGDTARFLKDGRFVITGIANHPDHTSTGIPDTLYVMVLQDAFDRQAMDNCFVKAEVVVEKPEGIDRFTKQYDAAVNPVLARLETVAGPCAERRAEKVKQDSESQIADGQSKLDEAKDQLKSGREELDKGWKELSEGEKKLHQLEEELTSGAAKLKDGENELWKVKLELDEGRRLLRMGLGALEKARGVLAEAEAKINEAQARLDQMFAPLDQAVEAAYQQLQSALDRLADAVRQQDEATTEEDRQAAAVLVEQMKQLVDEAKAAYDASLEAREKAVFPDETEALEQARAKYDEQKELYDAGEELYEEKRRQFEYAEKEYGKGLMAWYEARNKYWDGLKQLEEGQGQSIEGRQKLEDGEKKYAESQQEFRHAEAELNDAIRMLAELGSARWLFFDCRGNSSFVQLLLGSSNLASLEMTFSLMFILVGALVIYATISKMIDEQRSLVGAGKALGQYNREIFAKYLLFGVTATMLGTLLGTLVARFWMEVYILQNARRFYTFDTSRPVLLVRPTVIVVAAGVLLSVAATWFACKKLLKSTAVQLMLPRVPGGRKKEGKEGGHILSLYSRLILLNIRTDLKRVIVTLVSVAGCCALVVIGFTLKSAVEGALENQYTKIVAYDGRIRFDTEAAADAGKEIKQTLEKEGIDYTEIFDGVVTFRITENLVGEIICGDLTEISAFYRLLDWKTNMPLTPSDDGILVQKRTAESYDLEVGDELELTLSGTDTVKVRIAGIFDNYIGRIMLISPAYYRELLGKDCTTNAFYIRLNGADGQTLLEKLNQIEGFESYTPSDADKILFTSSSSLVTVVVAMFIFMAAIMAGVVLTNLTNIYILQKKPELTIMRINGFTVREVIGYVVRETVLTTSLGILIGIAMGAGVSYKIIRAMESVFIQYERGVSLSAWLYGALITLLFALVINVLVLRKIKHLKLTDMT